MSLSTSQSIAIGVEYQNTPLYVTNNTTDVMKRLRFAAGALYASIRITVYFNKLKIDSGLELVQENVSKWTIYR